jgi:hypothetical protein
MITTLIYLIAFPEENIPTKYNISMQVNEYCDGEGQVKSIHVKGGRGSVF